MLKFSMNAALTVPCIFLFFGKAFAANPAPITVSYNSSLGEASPDIPLSEMGLLGLGFPGERIPQQVKITQGATPSTIYISWITGSYQRDVFLATTVEEIIPLAIPSLEAGPNAPKPLASYGTSNKTLSSTATGASKIYGQQDGSAGEGNQMTNYISGTIHTVKITNLTPGTLYYYRLGAKPYQSEIFSFTTAPALGTYPARLAVWADVGTTLNATQNLANMLQNLATDPKTHGPAGVLMVGDFCYADDYGALSEELYDESEANGYSYPPKWDLWGLLTQNLTSKYPFQAAIGNHEIEPTNYALTLNITGESDTFVAVTNRYIFPSEDSGSSSPHYYSFEMSGAHIIVLGTYAAVDGINDWYVGGPQYTWLEADLKKINSTLTPWTIVMFHAAWYHTYKTTHYKEVECHRDGVDENGKALGFETLLYKYGVDVIFSGHVHAYERTFPVYKYNLDSCAPAYILVGDGGNVEGLKKKFVDTKTEGFPNNGTYSYSSNSCPNPANGDFGYPYSGTEGLKCLTLNDPITGLGVTGSLVLNPPQPETVASNLVGSYSEAGFNVPEVNGTYSINGTGSFCATKQPLWSAYREPSFGHGILDIVDEKTLTWTWHRNQDTLAHVADQVTFTKPTGCANRKASVAQA